jgi:hypothetical protein
MPSCIATPVGLTLTGIRSAKSSGATFIGRSRARGSYRIGLGPPLPQLPLEIGAVERGRESAAV